MVKVKISIPLTEPMNKNEYKTQLMKALKLGEGKDISSLVDDKLELFFGPEIEGKHQDGNVPPFYVSLNILDKIIHNAMLDFGASHNLMP